ncbi:XVIPCD domain-containing protein [Pseudomonas sp. CGJS7]|uniref:XVIPCD domain-containing protein n=1 Tax=Pseudomonas sp. CGJS7 TaxID=3109348 RepID=UPI0030088352
MNAAVDSIAPPGSRPVGDPAARRWYAGQATSQPPGTAYTALLPADDEWSRDTVLRAVVADALQRNGLTVDEDTLEATVEAAGLPGGALADVGLNWKLHPGETRGDARVSPPFHGYAVAMPSDLQTSLADYAKTWSAHRDTQPPAPVDRPISELKQLALTGGHNDVAQTLDALDAAIKAGSAAQRDGKPLDAVALSAVLEFASRSGRERDAAKILERYSAIKEVVGGAKEIGNNATRVFNGRDPITGKPLDTDDRVDAAFDLLSGGFKTAGNIGSVAMLLGARNAGLVGGLIGIAPVGLAVVAFAAGAYELIKHVREAILAPQWNEFRERFPFAEGMEPKRAITGVMRQIAGMPTDAGNALSTATRILDGIGQNPETRERFLEFLKQKVQPDSLVEALASGQGLGKLSEQQQMLLAQAAKGSAREFLDLELKDVKRYVRDRDGDRERGTYLLPAAQQEAANRNTNKLGGAVEEGLRLAGILTSGANALNGQYRDLLDKVKGTELQGKLNEQQQKNLAAALIPATREGGLTQVDHLVASKDGSRVFAVQGDLDSPTRRMVAIDVASGSQQSVETSSKLVAHQTANNEAQTQTTQAQSGRGL